MQTIDTIDSIDMWAACAPLGALPRHSLGGDSR